MKSIRRSRLWATTGVIAVTTGLVYGAFTTGGSASSGTRSAATTIPTVPPETVPVSPTTVAPEPTAPTPTSVRPKAASRPAPRTSPTTVVTPRTSPTTVVATPPARGSFPGFFPAWDWESLDHQERAVADGHQPWTLDPVQVTASYLSSIGLEGHSLGGWEPTGTAGGSVTYTRGGLSGSVRLARPAGSSLWVVVSSSSSRFEVTSVQRSGDLLDVTVTTPVEGRVTVLTGPFASEWVCERSHDVHEGELDVTFLAFSGTDADLLRIRYDAADGSMALAEWRVDAISKGARSA